MPLTKKQKKALQRLPNANRNAARAAMERQNRPRPPRRPRSESQNIPVSYARTASTQSPKIKTGNGLSHVVHAEMFDIVQTSEEGFSTKEWTINPALESVFPWFFRTAEQYESYEVDSLRFIYKPACPTSTQGIIAIGVDFDIMDAAPTNLHDMAAAEGCQYGPCYMPLVYTCKKSSLDTCRRRFTKHHAATEGDLKNVHVGKFIVATEGITSTNTLGTLTVEYNIHLFTPQKTVISSGCGQGVSQFTSDTNFDLIKGLTSRLPVHRQDDQTAVFDEDYRGMMHIKAQDQSGSDTYHADPVQLGATNTCEVSSISKTVTGGIMNSLLGIDAKRGDKLNMGVIKTAASSVLYNWTWNLARVYLPDLIAFITGGGVTATNSSAPAPYYIDKYGHKMPGQRLPTYNPDEYDDDDFEDVMLRSTPPDPPTMLRTKRR